MTPFCCNERCFMSALEQWPDNKPSVEVALPTGAGRVYTRDRLVVKKTGHEYALCDSCGNVVTLIRGEPGEAGLRASFGVPRALDVSASQGLRPFCANPRCFMHDFEVPDCHAETDVGLPNGDTRTYHRDWLIKARDQRKFPLCDTCGNVVAAIRGDGEGLPAPAGVDLSAELVGPDGQVLHRHQGEADADIDEPKILH